MVFFIAFSTTALAKLMFVNLNLGQFFVHCQGSGLRSQEPMARLRFKA